MISAADVIRCATLVGVLAMAVGGCKKDPGASGGRPPGGPPATSPAIAVAEQKSGTITAEGGEIRLGGDLRVVFPAGAMAKACEVTVKRIDPRSCLPARAADRRIVLDVTCPEKLLKPAQVRLPLPKEAKAQDAEDIIVGRLDPGGVIAVSRGATIELTPRGPELVAPADHFSIIVVTFAVGVLAKSAAVISEKIGSLFDPPPEKVDPAPNWVPVFYQGDGPECLSTSVEMACKAVKPDAREIWRLMELSKIVRAGLGPLEMRLLGNLSAGIKAHSGIEPSIYYWQGLLDATDTPYLGAMKRYIMRTLGEGIPIVLNSSEMLDSKTGHGHAVILLGYDKSGNFFGVDPRGGGGDQAGLVTLTQKALGIEMSMKGSFVTIALPVALDAMRPRVTMNVLPNSAWFLTDKGPSGPACMLTWDGGFAGGVGWLAKPMLASSLKDGPVRACVPWEVTSLCIGNVAGDNAAASGGVEICNTDARAHKVSVSLEVQNTTKGARVKLGGRDGLMAGATVEAHRRAGIPFQVKLGNLFPADAKEPQQFELRLGLFVEGVQTDTAVVPFTVEPKEAPLFDGIVPKFSFQGTSLVNQECSWAPGDNCTDKTMDAALNISEQAPLSATFKKLSFDAEFTVTSGGRKGGRVHLQGDLADDMQSIRTMTITFDTETERPSSYGKGVYREKEHWKAVVTDVPLRREVLENRDGKFRDFFGQIPPDPKEGPRMTVKVEEYTRTESDQAKDSAGKALTRTWNEGHFTLRGSHMDILLKLADKK